MNCYYCDQIQRADPGYRAKAARFDLGSGAPRCWLHWRYICGQCNQPSHFMAMAWDHVARRFFCRSCAAGVEEVAASFWGWDYHFRYQSPWTQQWFVSLDRLEFEGRHPLQRQGDEALHPSISGEPHLVRYPAKWPQWRMDHVPDDDEIRSNWNANADRWDSGYDDDGDSNRRLRSDEPMLAMLGDVNGKQILDAGCGAGYLCRKLARKGAKVTGVELSDVFLAKAKQRESAEGLGIRYIEGSIASMSYLADATFDAAVSNYVLMDVRDYTQAIAEVYRLLRLGGVFVATISHPCFTGRGWYAPAADSPRREDRQGFLVDRYFDRGPMMSVWGNFDPVIGFHRPLRDYWAAFTNAGFQVTGFEEPCITDRGRTELPPWRVKDAMRISYSCIFRLVKK